MTGHREELVRKRLSPHFHVTEFACKDGTPVPSSCYAQLQQLCVEFLEPVRAIWGPMLIHSGYRTPSYNKKVGGAPQSFHVYRARRRGVAADFTCAAGYPRDWALTLERHHPGGLGIYRDHVHVDNRTTHARW